MARSSKDSDSAKSTLDTSRGRAAGIYELIRADVIAGVLAPAERLSESALSRKYGASRSPIREALASLERDGLIERNGMGARVRQRSEGEILDIYQVRIYLEGAIASDAAQRRHPIDVHRLNAAVEFCDGVDAGDPSAMTAGKNAFRNALATASHNVTLIDLQGRLSAQLSTFSSTVSLPGRWSELRKDYTQIARAVVKEDAETARKVAEKTMIRARDLRLHVIQDSLQQNLLR